MKNWRAILSVMVIFSAGVVTGGLLMRSHLRAHSSVPTAAPGGPPGNGIWKTSRAQFVEKLHKQLDLTADQCAQVDKIMKESHERMAKLWEPIAPQANEETCQAREKIQMVLTADQRVKFEESFKPRKGKEHEKASEHKDRPETNLLLDLRLDKNGDLSVKECCRSKHD